MAAREREAVHETLRDGTPVRLGLVRFPTDLEKYLDGFEHLSEESRYRRFFSPTPRLTPTMLRRLTDTDDWDHLAVGAEMATTEPGVARGLGIARYIRSSAIPDAAEISIAVIDEMQGRGLGSLLLGQLAGEASRRGIGSFIAYTLPGNEAVQVLLRRLDPCAQPRLEDGLVRFELRLRGDAGRWPCPPLLTRAHLPTPPRAGVSG